MLSNVSLSLNNVFIIIIMIIIAIIIIIFIFVSVKIGQRSVSEIGGAFASAKNPNPLGRTEDMLLAEENFEI